MSRNSMSGQNQIRRGSYSKDQPFQSRSMNLLRIFFSVLCICIWPFFALIAFEFEVLFILLQALEFTIGSYRVIFRFLSNLFPYTLFCVFLITVFTTFELFCVALIKMFTLIRSQLKQIDCCSFLAPYLNNDTVNHFCKCYFTCHKVDFKIS